jgi:hypothetical protein
MVRLISRRITSFSFSREEGLRSIEVVIFSDLRYFLQKGTAGSNDCSAANTLIINKIREITARNRPFRGSFREVKFWKRY